MTLLPHVVLTYKANVDTLYRELASGEMTPAKRMAFRNLIDCIVVHPTRKRMPYEFTPYGRLGALMGGINLFPTGRAPAEILAEQGVSYIANGKPEKSVSS